MAMMKSAFCYVSLQTGSIIVGWMTLVLVVYNALATGVKILSPKDMDDDYIPGTEGPIVLTPTDSYNITLDGETTEANWQESSPLEDKTLHYYFFYAHTLLNIIVLICLLIGSYKRRPGFLIPYLIDYTIIIGLLAFVTIYSLVVGHHVGHLIFKLIAIPIGIYFLCIVASFFVELRSGMRVTMSQAV